MHRNTMAKKLLLHHIKFDLGLHHHSLCSIVSQVARTYHFNLDPVILRKEIITQ